jgi:diguanylate cyclase (GGDEF)-like protein
VVAERAEISSPINLELRRLLGRWRAEHASVADEATATNLRRLSWLAPVVALLNAIHVLAFYVQSTAQGLSEPTYRWIWALIWLHLSMGVFMVGCAVGARKLRFAVRSLRARILSTSVVLVGMLFAVLVVMVDQWITPNITPFLIACMVLSAVLYQQPQRSAWIFALTYGAFFFAMGLTQPNVQLLLSNRLNGAAACVLGWALSVLLWRKFTTIALQQVQLVQANVELQNKQRELEKLTRLDGLTGLFNRSTFVELTQQELDRAQRQGSATALLILDLDHFKRVNDTWGHPAGDAVLRHVAATATKSVRSTDLVGRLGGEEFIVLLPATTLDAARKLAEKLRSRLESSPTPWTPAPIPATASIGLACNAAGEKRDFESLYNEADKALYLAKTRGRNRVMP